MEIYLYTYLKKKLFYLTLQEVDYKYSINSFIVFLIEILSLYTTIVSLNKLNISRFIKNTKM